MTNTDRTRKYEQRRRNSLMNISFENQVALVTGAGSGMGLATAKAFAEAGASVVLADIDEQAGWKGAEGIGSPGQEAIAGRCHVAEEAYVAAIIQQTGSNFRRPHDRDNN